MSAQYACLTTEVPPLGTRQVKLESGSSSIEIAVVRDDEGTLHAISDVCSHGQVSLSDGEVEDCTIECWLHGSQFDLRTGKPLSPPAVKAVPVYPVTVDGERVLVDVDAPLSS